MKRSLIALVPMGLAIAWSYGFVALCFGSLNLITANFTAVLMGLGIDFAIHFLARASEARETRNPADALHHTWRKGLPPILIGAVTSAVAFLACATTEFHAFAEMGLTSAFGLAAMCVFTAVLMPALLMLSGGLNTPAPMSSGRRWADPFAALIVRYAPLLCLGAMASAVAVLLASAQPGFNTRAQDFVPANTASVQGLNRLERSGYSTFTASIPVESLAEARRITRVLRENPSVRTVRSPSDLIPAALNRRELEEALSSPVLPAAPATPPRALGLALQTALPILPRPLRAEVSSLASVLLDLSPEATERWKRLTTQVPTVLDAVLSAGAQLAGSDALRLPEPLRFPFQSVGGRSFAVYADPVPFSTVTESLRFVEAIEELTPNAAGVGLSLFRESELIRSGFEQAAWIAWV
ncbi:MAG: MMPL family transporter, partial [Myxococcota bacterium]